MKHSDKAVLTLLNIFHYYYFVLSILNLIFIYFDLNILLNITTILMIISIVIELCCGYIRGCFGIMGYIVSIGLCIFFTKDIWIGISLGMSILNIIYIFINFLFNKFLVLLDKIFNKNAK